MPEHHIIETTSISDMAETATNPIMLREALEEKVEDIKKTIPWYAISAFYKEKKLYKFLLEVLNNPKFSVKFLLYDWANQVNGMNNEQLSSNNQNEQSTASASGTAPEDKALRDEIARLNSSLEEYKQRNTLLEAENKQLKEEVETLKAEVERLKSLCKKTAKVDDQEIPFKDMQPQHELQKLKDENSYLKKINLDQGRKNTQYAKDILDLNREIEKLKGLLFQQQSNSNKLII